jgi:hypothetical protein
MKISKFCGIAAFLVLSVGAAGVQAQSSRDEELLVPLARGVVEAPASVNEGEVIEELPAVVAPRWSAADEALATDNAMHKATWLGLLSLCAVAAGVLTRRRFTPKPQPRLSLPPGAGEGRISLV